MACSDTNDDGKDTYIRKELPAMDGIRIAWDYNSMHQFANSGGYPRLRRLQDQSLVAVYDKQGTSELVRSYNNGLTWSAPITTFDQFTYTNELGKKTLVNIANSEVFQLVNGDILVGCNYRPTQDEIAPYCIAIRRSTNNGASWHKAQVLYDAAPRFTDGCWEPAFLQLPNGELQVYFANENPFQQSDEQEIAMLSSQDNGKTWTSQPKRVSFRGGRRDGMPVPVLLNDEIVVSIEDNNIDAFKPYTVRTKITDNWATPVLANSPQREYASAQKVPDIVYQGAPYLMKLPTGETLISYQTTENRSANWELSTMEVAIGNAEARNFDRRTQPFHVPVNKEAKWNSLTLWDETTVVALASTNFQSADVAPWMIKGHIIPQLIIKEKNISQYPLFVGAKGATQLKAGIGIDNDYLYLNCLVADNTPYTKADNSMQADGVYIYIDVQNTSIASPDKGVYKLWCNSKGNAQLWEGDKGSWVSISAAKVQIVANQTDEGYSLALAIPKSITGTWNAKAIRLGLALSAYQSESVSYIEPLANTILDASHTWIKLNF
jgi:hypothetical protein